MILKEIIQRIQVLYSKGVESDDSRLSSRHIYSKILTARAKLISQALNKKQRLSQWNYQSIPCIELIKVEAHDCPCIPPMGCEILRTKYPLPNPIASISEDKIEWVRSIEKSVKIDRVSINALNSQKANKYTSKKIQYFIENGYLYISTPTKLKYISLRGIFEDPIEAASYASYCDECVECNCIDYLNFDLPIDHDTVDTIIEMAANELVVLFSKNIEDATNNSRDNLREQSK